MKSLVYVDVGNVFEKLVSDESLKSRFEFVSGSIEDFLKKRSNYRNFAIITDNTEDKKNTVISNNIIDIREKTIESIIRELNWICSDFGREGKMDDEYTFVTSDTHFNHKNIIQYCDRPFSSVEEMNETMINNWNSVVGKDDIVWHLGDFALGDKNKIPEIVSRLNGRINLVMGNHDHNKLKFYYDAGFNRVYDRKVIIQDYLVLSHAPMEFVKQPFFNISGHVHDCKIYNTISKDGCIVCVERWDYKPVSLSEIKKTWLKTYGEDKD